MNREDGRIIEGMKRQAKLRDRALAGGRRLGWKSGFGTEAAMELLGIDQPLCGFLSDATLLPSGTKVAVGDWAVPLLEAEVAVRLGSGLGPGSSPDQAAAAIEGVAAAVELVDLGAFDQVEEILAGNIFHRHVLLGGFHDCDATTLDEVRIEVRVNGTGSDPADPRALVGELAGVVAALADQAGLIGERLLPGDVVITGAAVAPAPIRPGDSYEVKLTGGSSVAVEIA